jgi:phosphomevalonate kinase
LPFANTCIVHKQTCAKRDVKTKKMQANDQRKKETWSLVEVVHQPKAMKYTLLAGGTLLCTYFLYRSYIHGSKVSKTIVSAPGKVLITGGYLVLENGYSGLVLATSSRFYSSVETAIAARRTDSSSFKIQFHSPQFYSKTEFVLSRSSSIFEGNEIRISRASDSKENKYIEFSILFAVSVVQYFASQKLDRTNSMKVQVVADNDFYSQRQNLKDLGKPVDLKSLKELPAFYAPDGKNKIHKTGLGSSAALVTSLVAALLLHFEVVDINTDNGREMVHRLSQFVHCLAQGKIGSGFDVSAATFGSQKYTRFSSQVLKSCLELAERKNHALTYYFICDQELINIIVRDLELELLKQLRPTSKWDNQHIPFQLPPGLSLFVADVDQGSNTPSMVRQVLQWKSDNKEEATEVWNQINSLNNSVELLFNELTSFSKRNFETYMHTLSELSRIPSSEWLSRYEQKASLSYMIADCLSRIRYNFGYIRQKLKYMGQQSGVPIEPDEQTKLLDATMNVNGCLIAGVPGAGGYDAIFSILFGNEQEARACVEQLWLNYSNAVVCPLLLKESNSKGIENVPLDQFK